MKIMEWKRVANSSDTPELEDRKRKSSQLSEEENYATEDIKRHQKSESSLGIHQELFM